MHAIVLVMSSLSSYLTFVLRLRYLQILDAAIDCIGQFRIGECSASCGSGTATKTYSITTPAGGSGSRCPYADGHSEQVDCGVRTPCPSTCLC